MFPFDGPHARVAAARIICTALAVAFASQSAAGRERLAGGEHATGERRLHFAHPLVTESISPDKKVFLGYRFRSLGEGRRDDTWLFGAEYAFHPSFSVEVLAPYAVVDRDETHATFGNTEALFKFANFAFERSGVLLGYGMGFELPTGNDEAAFGSDHIVELSPFLNAGYKRGGFEAVAFGRFEIPANQRPEDGARSAVAFSGSLLRYFGERVQGLLELDGESGLGPGEHDNRFALSPGIKLRPAAGRELFVGFAWSAPIVRGEEFGHRAIVSFFYHFEG